jgi:hypothetical protein
MLHETLYGVKSEEITLHVTLYGVRSEEVTLCVTLHGISALYKHRLNSDNNLQCRILGSHSSCCYLLGYNAV